MANTALASNFRSERDKRKNARRRDRGGIFQPLEKNAMLDMLMARRKSGRLSLSAFPIEDDEEDTAPSTSPSVCDDEFEKEMRCGVLDNPMDSPWGKRRGTNRTNDELEAQCSSPSSIKSTRAQAVRPASTGKIPTKDTTRPPQRQSTSEPEGESAPSEVTIMAQDVRPASTVKMSTKDTTRPPQRQSTSEPEGESASNEVTIMKSIDEKINRRRSVARPASSPASISPPTLPKAPESPQMNKSDTISEPSAEYYDDGWDVAPETSNHKSSWVDESIPHRTFTSVPKKAPKSADWSRKPGRNGLASKAEPTKIRPPRKSLQSPKGRQTKKPTVIAVESDDEEEVTDTVDNFIESFTELHIETESENEDSNDSYVAPEESEESSSSDSLDNRSIGDDDDSDDRLFCSPPVPSPPGTRTHKRNTIPIVVIYPVQPPIRRRRQYNKNTRTRRTTKVASI
ncbi:hypothetical protein DACRYDRAFT_16797 [Dacryopinax primogenitus]|uniref:Uncharacterized protein n=1 Tax=Dacryopinax primogenitus (strain DJM 731) TaxID=1858805 RepID=M5FS93_DACPD|nr:uncharacterized protein DACRYDRAFT_16797 [Dacryopinax primogenitus]EJU00236.1 hypothetical protein DACRYDRAFT_16797 [Dacryopinax primogenitus]